MFEHLVHPNVILIAFEHSFSLLANACSFILYGIRKELEAVDASKQFPNPFNPLTDQLPAEIDKEFDKAIEAAKANNEEALLNACHAIEAYFNFPKPNELVKKAEVPGGMYSNMVAQLKQLNSMDILEKAMELIPTVRLAAGLPPLVTPTSQIVGAQAVNCALDIKAGKPMYSNVSNQFVNLVKGEYGKTPVPVDPEFRLKIAGTREEIPYDTSKYQMQPNPELPEAGGVKLAANEKEVLLLELFPQVAKNFLTKQKVAAYEAQHKADAPQAEKVVAEEKKNEPITGKTVKAPMPGSSAIPVSDNTNFIQFKGNTVYVQLAFNGIAGPNGLGGITVQGTPSQITTNTDKHGNITYSFYVNGIALTAQVVVNLSAGSNYANATVYPMMNGNNLTFSGTLVPTSQSGIFRSGFISY